MHKFLDKRHPPSLLNPVHHHHNHLLKERQQLGMLLFTNSRHFYECAFMKNVLLPRNEFCNHVEWAHQSMPFFLRLTKLLIWSLQDYFFSLMMALLTCLGTFLDCILRIPINSIQIKQTASSHETGYHPVTQLFLSLWKWMEFEKKKKRL